MSLRESRIKARHLLDRSSPDSQDFNSVPMHNAIHSRPGKDNISIDREMRQSLDFGDQAAVQVRTDLSALPPKEDKAYQSYTMGVFNAVSKSIRLAVENPPDQEGEAASQP